MLARYRWPPGLPRSVYADEDKRSDVDQQRVDLACKCLRRGNGFSCCGFPISGRIRVVARKNCCSVCVCRGSVVPLCGPYVPAKRPIAIVKIVKILILPDLQIGHLTFTQIRRETVCKRSVFHYLLGKNRSQGFAKLFASTETRFLFSHETCAQSNSTHILSVSGQVQSPPVGSVSSTRVRQRRGIASWFRLFWHRIHRACLMSLAFVRQPPRSRIVMVAMLPKVRRREDGG